MTAQHRFDRFPAQSPEEAEATSLEWAIRKLRVCDNMTSAGAIEGWALKRIVSRVHLAVLADTMAKTIARLSPQPANFGTHVPKGPPQHYHLPNRSRIG